VIEFRVLELATGRTHVCVGKGATDALKCFGPDSANGELGGALVAATETVDVPGSAGAIWLAAGAEHTCAIFPGGGVRCWGSNAAGQLGDGTTATPGLGGDLRPLGTPVAVTGR
jgi:alpha-tubulin suppressor-like RCC1 family protein